MCIRDRLSIDARLQYILRSETARQMAQFEAQAATGLIMDVHTGEVLALVSLPDFDLNAAGSAKPEAMFDRATLGVYEVGSIFKIFNTAMALDAHTATLASRYDATKPIEIAGFTIHDDHPLKRWLSVPEIFEYSSNIGAAKMAAEAGTERPVSYTHLDVYKRQASGRISRAASGVPATSPTCAATSPASAMPARPRMLRRPT